MLLGDSYNLMAFSQLKFDWESFYGYVGTNPQAIILEVRSQNASLTEIVKGCLLWLTKEKK